MKQTLLINKRSFIFTLSLLLVFSLSLLLSSSLSINFVLELTERVLNRTLRDHNKWINILKGVIHIPLLISIIIFFFYYTNIGIVSVKKIQEQWNIFISEIKQRKYLYLFLVLITFFFFAYYQIIHADILYADDMSRSHDGDRNWISWGRYISEFLSILLHCTIKLTDIAPLTQFIAIIIMSCTIICLFYILTYEKARNFFLVLPLTFVFISPYFIQAFLYRFDSPYFALSVLFPIISFIFIYDLKAYASMSFIMLILSCMAYQSSQSIYIMIVIFFTLQQFIKKSDFKEILKFVFVSIITYASALIIYELLFAANASTSHTDGYFSTAFSFNSTISNLKSYFNYLAHYTGGILTRCCICFCLVLSIISIVLLSKNRKILSLILSIIALILSFVLSMGPYILFEKTLLTGRTFMGLNILITLILFIPFSFSIDNNSTKIIKTIFILPVILCIYSSIAYLYTYGNALKTQKEYNTFRYTILLNDLSEFIDPNEIVYTAFDGTIGLCQALETAKKNYPFHDIPITPVSKSIWNIDYSLRFNFIFEDEFLDEKPDWPLLKSNYYHNIYGKDNHFYILLKNPGNL